MNPLRIAVIGAGHLGRIHARLLSQNAEFQLLGVVDPIVTAREAVAREFSTTPFADFHEVVDQLDAAVVATPTRHHFAVALELLQRGKHVFVEKPLTPTSAEAEQLAHAARQRDLVLQVGHVERFNPAFVAVRPHLGKLKFVEAVRASGYTFRSVDIGVVLDLMIHDLDLVLSLNRSSVIEVRAVGTAVLGPHEDMAHVQLTFADGCVAVLKASRTSYIPQRSMQLFTDRNCATLDFATGTAKLITPDEQLVRGELDVHALSPEGKAQVREHLFDELLRMTDLPVEKRNAIADEQHEFLHCIRTATSPQATGDDSRRVLQVVEEILHQLAGHTLADFAAETPPTLHPFVSPSSSPPLRKAG